MSRNVRLSIGCLLLLASVLGSACTQRSQVGPGLEAFEGNPLMAEAIGDQMIDFVTSLQIRANERGAPITDPVILRGIDEAFVYARRIVEIAHKQQEEGKRGGFHGLGDGAVLGEVLLHGEQLHFGYNFVTDAAPGMRVILAQHVAPHTEEELFSGSTLDLGPLQNLLGPQTYAVGPLTEDEWNRYRTVALFSKPLKMVLGIAQIRGGVPTGQAKDAREGDQGTSVQEVQEKK